MRELRFTVYTYNPIGRTAHETNPDGATVTTNSRILQFKR